MTQPTQTDILAQAATFLGTKEIIGAKHNPAIVDMLRNVGLRRHGDETPWCAAFVNWVLSSLVIKGTGSARARSFEDWGMSLNPDPERAWELVCPGDIVVLWRKREHSAFGHVGFFLRREGHHIWLLGGNQGNRVSAKRYHNNRVVTFRRIAGCE